MSIVWLFVFWAMQAIAQVIFKYGSGVPDRWLLCFVGGNVFGASSIWFLMLLYKQWSPNLALGMGTAGGFLAAQAALAIVFRAGVTPLQGVGAAAVALGMGLFVLGGK
ncbi:MAG TPA: hypothetical protein PL033_02000 [Candidatus Brocadiia bacterium]|nr:hypothetical protein [Candidatus Brocadiia bacterium]